MNKVVKNNFILGFILGGIIFGSVGTFAASIIAGSSVSYDNSQSGLETTNIQDAIDGIYDKTNYGNATSGDLLADKSALVNGQKISGTIVNRQGWTSTPTDSGKITIPEGYHDGTGYVDTTNIYNQAYSEGSSSGKKVVKLITGGNNKYCWEEAKTLDVKTYIPDDWSSLTTANFKMMDFSMASSQSGATGYYGPSLSYNSTTGILTYRWGGWHVQVNSEGGADVWINSATIYAIY